jgi:hypothetical protein
LIRIPCEEFAWHVQDKEETIPAVALDDHFWPFTLEMYLENDNQILQKEFISKELKDFSNHIILRMAIALL